VDAEAFASPMMPQTPDAIVRTEEVITPGTSDETGDRLPLAMEATDGIAPELTTHKESALAGGDDLSPEEQAIQGIVPGDESGEVHREFADDDADTAALAEGRAVPPAPSRDE
jgi:hypothetical protein